MIPRTLLLSSFAISSIFCQNNQPLIPPAIATPPSVETRLGTLEFPLGVPTPKTVETLYNHIDYIHGINAFLTAFSGASMWAVHEGFLKANVHDNEVLIFSTLMDAKSLFLTANADTLYFFSFLDLSKGPVVVEMPPRTMSVVDDMWFRWVTDMGMSGPDRGLGGKYLIVPPGYKKCLPEGYFIAHARTTRVFCLGRAFLEQNDPKPAVDRIKQELRIYPYIPGGYGTSMSDILAGDPHPALPWTAETWSSVLTKQPVQTHFIEGSGLIMNTIPPNDFSFYEMMHALVQDQPAEALDPEIAGNLAAVGIVKGKAFQPDEQMKERLSAAVVHGNAVSRVVVFRPRPSEGFNYYDPSSQWMNPLFVGGYTFLTPPPQITDKGVEPYPYDGARKLDARTALFYVATGITPSMVMRLAGIGSQYLIAFLDNQNQTLDGAKSYRLKLPSPIPAAQFWSVTLYDNQTRSMLSTPQNYPRAGSQSFPSPAAVADQEGTTLLYFGPEQPHNGAEGNWIQTLPGQGYFVILRLYSPLQPFFDKTWRPSEIEEI